MDTKEKIIDDVQVKKDRERVLILWNDEVNTFEHVIEKLIEVCGHTAQQAEQCALTIHLKGKLDVKHGSFQEMKEMKDKLVSYKLNVTIE